MSFEITSDEQALLAAVQDAATKRLAPKAAELDAAAAHNMEDLKFLADIGCFGINLPEDYGGPGVGSIAMSEMVAAITEACASTASILTAHFLATDSILIGGTEEQRNTWLPQVATGEKIGSFGLTEPGAGSNPAEMTTVARRTEDGWHLKGVKHFITNAGFADFVIVYAKTDEEAGHRGISAFIVPTDTPGLEFNPPEKTMGLRGSPIYEFRADCTLPAEALLGEEGAGFKTAMQVLDRGRIEVAAMSLGICRAALSDAVAWAKTREINGKPIGRMQAIAFKLADMQARTEAARLFTMQAAEQRDTGEDFTMESALAKLVASEAAHFVTDEALQIHGGYGFTQDFRLERLVRDARIYRIYEGSSEIQRTIIGRKLTS